MNKADKLFKDFTTVKYKVTGMFGMRNNDDIFDARLINAEGDMALLYHPSNSQECGMFEMCKFDSKSNCYVSCSHQNYVNYETFGMPKKIKMVVDMD